MLYLCCTYSISLIINNMSSTKIIFRTTKASKEGKYPLYIRIIKNRKAQFISLGLHLLPEEWDQTKNRVKTRHPNSARLNSYISQKLAEAEDMTLQLRSKDASTSSLKIKEKIKGKASESFSRYFERHKEQLLSNEKIGTYIKVKSGISKLNQFTKNRDLQFVDIDYDFLKRYNAFLVSSLGNTINTVHGTLKILRKLFNDAVREGIIEVEQNPFLRYKLVTEKTNKIYLTELELLEIEKVNLNSASSMAVHRDLFLFACVAAGLRVSDLLQLKWKNFNGTHLSLVTQKNSEPISIHLPNKALEIIKRYNTGDKNEDSYLFPIMKLGPIHTALQLNAAISSATAYLNKDLKEIAKKAKISKHISMHTSRHTWATRALKKGMRFEYVSKLMGHANLKTTQIYAKIVNTELDKAMEVFND